MPEPGIVPVEEPTAAGSALDIVELHPNDVISVTVFREPDLSAERLQVEADGTVSIPLLGTIMASGKTPAQLAETIRQGLTPRYLKHPSVNVRVVEYGSHLVTVEGGVVTSGVYQYKPGMRLSSALALAGGPTRISRPSQIAIFRSDGRGISVAKFDYNAITRGEQPDPVLAVNDRIVVGTSGLSQFYQDMLKALPSAAVFSQIF